MKRFVLCLVFLTVVLGGGVRLTAQDAAALAEKQEAEERAKRLNATLTGLMEANAELQRRVTALNDDLREVREAQARAANTSSIQEDLRKLAEKIQEVDRKREADREMIVEQIARLGKTLAAAPPPSHKTASAPAPSPAPEKNGYEYAVQSGDTMSSILNLYNQEFKKKGKKPITLKQLQDANPNLKPSRMQVGQKVYIPLPAE